MANTKKRKTTRRKKKGGRKLEITIYVVAILVAVLVIYGIVCGIVALINALFGLEINVGFNVFDSEPTSSVSEQQDPTSSTPSVDVSDVTSEPSSSETQSKPESEGAPESQEQSTPNSQTVTPSGRKSRANADGDYVTYTKSGAAELNEWYLLLVNPTNLITSDWKTSMTDVGGEELDSRIVSAYRDMVEDAADDGVSIYAISGYRSYATQQRLYNNRVERAKNENPSFTQQEAEVYAAARVARPGTSEHQTGLAIDFNSVETSFGNTKAGKWLKAHAHEYGFILRYEEDKQGKTGVTWEPWHYRFVGVKHATKIHQTGMCLEEYVDYLKTVR